MQMWDWRNGLHRIVSPQVPETGKRDKCSEKERWSSLHPEEVSTWRGQAERSPEKEQGSAGSWRLGEVACFGMTGRPGPSLE